MARSSTSFKPGNQARAKPGNKLAVRHGGYSLELIQAKLPAIKARVMAELAQVPYLTPPDNSLIERYVFMNGQAEVMEEHFEADGGFLNEWGAPKEGVSLYLTVVHRMEGMAKVLGLGPNPRTQVLQGMANTGKELVLIKAAQERMRARLLAG